MAAIDGRWPTSRAGEREAAATRIREQIESGELRIRQASPEEMARFAREREQARLQTVASKIRRST